MKYIKTVISKDAPQVSDGLWAQPVSGGFILYLLSGGRWVPLKSTDEAGTNTLNDDEAYKAVRTVEEGTSDGTVKVDGTNVSVHGLGSSAYKDTTFFVGSGTANASDDTIKGAKKYADSLASNYDAAGSATAAKNDLIGDEDLDDEDDMTLYGLKAYVRAYVADAIAALDVLNISLVGY